MGKKLKKLTTAQMLRMHAAAVFNMPVGEQFIGGRDVAFHSAMHQIADWIERHDARRRKQSKAKGKKR